MARSASFSHPFSDITPDRRRALTTELFDRIAELDARGDADVVAGERERLLDEVVLVNLCVAHAIARRYRDRGIAVEDLEQVAGAALVRAAHHFDLAHERDFLAYAVPSIRGEVRRHFRDQGWMVRPPRRLQQLRLKVLDEQDRQRGEGLRPTAESVAEALAITSEEVREALATEGCFAPTSLDLRVGDDGTASLGDLLADPDTEADASAIEARVVLRPVLRQLKPRDQRLLRLRFHDDLTQQEIADDFGVTQTQVSRLLLRVLRDLREALDDPAEPEDDVAPGPTAPAPSAANQPLAQQA